MFNNRFRWGRLATILLLVLVGLGRGRAVAGPDFFHEDDLNRARNGTLRWGGRGLPYKEAVEIRDSLVNTMLGKVVADRHGVGHSGPFGIFGAAHAPFPGNAIFVSLWGSKIEGCFVEMIVQYAPPGGKIDPKAITPVLMEIGVGDRIVELPPQSNVKITPFKRAYNYTVRQNGQDREVSSYWYMSHNLFAVDATVAKLLSKAPRGKEARVRLTYEDNNSDVIKLDDETVDEWREAYGFNPNCISPAQAQREQELATVMAIDLVERVKAYRGSPIQEEALVWLESQIPSSTLLDFSQRWRNQAEVQTTPVQLLEVVKFYGGLPNQDAALAWLRDNLELETLVEFDRQWID